MLTLVMLGIIIGVGMIAIGYLNNDSITEFIPLLAQGKVEFLDVMNAIFPSTYFLVTAITANNIFAFIMYLLINVFAYLIFMVLADKIYIPGVNMVIINEINLIILVKVTLILLLKLSSGVLK